MYIREHVMNPRREVRELVDNHYYPTKGTQIATGVAATAVSQQPGNCRKNDKLGNPTTRAKVKM